MTAVYEDEVQARTPDGELRWRTVSTAELMAILLTPPDPLETPQAMVTRRRKRVGEKCG